MISLKKQQEGIFIEVSEFCLNKQKTGFTRAQVQEHLEKMGYERQVVYNWLITYCNSGTVLYGKVMFIIEDNHAEPQKTKYVLSAEAEQAYIDYLELKDARKNANLAFWLAVSSMLVAGIFGILQVWAQLLDAHSWRELMWFIFH